MLSPERVGFVLAITLAAVLASVELATQHWADTPQVRAALRSFGFSADWRCDWIRGGALCARVPPPAPAPSGRSPPTPT